jgi:hypothetical protein
MAIRLNYAASHREAPAMILILLAAAASQAQALPAFMTGCWDLLEDKHWTQECWMEPKGGLMLGASREGIGDKLRSWEQMRVEQAPNGSIVLMASPGGRPAVPFKAKNISKTAAEFTNAAHDYPQRIRYELKDDKLEAEISRIDGSKSVRWTYSRENR